MDNLQNIGKHNTFFNLVSSERKLVNKLENIVCWQLRYESNEIHNPGFEIPTYLLAKCKTKLENAR